MQLKEDLKDGKQMQMQMKWNGCDLVEVAEDRTFEYTIHNTTIIYSDGKFLKP